MRFLFYDVETANQKRSSICAVGWCLVQDMSIISQGYSLINPNTVFSPHCVSVHGITADQVITSPTFEWYWKNHLEGLMSQAVVVAHCATSMDICATRQALSFAGIDDKVIEYYDFLPVSQSLLPELESHKLNALADWANIQFNHHRADQDALSLFEIAKAICRHKNFDSLEELFIRSKCSMQDTRKPAIVDIDFSREASPSRVSGDYLNHYLNQNRYTGEVEPIDEALDGCTFCITGNLPIERSEAERRILERGGKFRTSVSSKTSFLVVGQYPDSGNEYISSKQRKALELIDEGVSIQIISPDQFMEILQSPETNVMLQSYRDAKDRKKQKEQEKKLNHLSKIAVKRESKISEKAEARKTKPTIPSVIQMSLSGDFIAKFDSVTVAAQKTGINPKSIRDAAKGLQRTAGGFAWKFCSLEADSSLQQQN